MCISQPARLHCRSCGKHFADNHNFITECARSKLARKKQLRNQGGAKHPGDGIRENGMCEGGIVEVDPWRDHYQSLCEPCDELEKASAERERLEAERRAERR